MLFNVGVVLSFFFGRFFSFLCFGYFGPEMLFITQTHTHNRDRMDWILFLVFVDWLSWI